MQSPGFNLVTTWRIPAAIEEIDAVLADIERFPDWWGEVYLRVEVLAAGDARGIGRTARVLTRGWLPYRLDWTARVAEADRPHGWTIDATGDLVGTGIWRLEQQGDHALAVYDWRVRAEKRALRRLAPLLGAAFAANHRWAMERGREGLLREIDQRRAASLLDAKPARVRRTER